MSCGGGRPQCTAASGQPHSLSLLSSPPPALLPAPGYWLGRRDQPLLPPTRHQEDPSLTVAGRSDEPGLPVPAPTASQPAAWTSPSSPDPRGLTPACLAALLPPHVTEPGRSAQPRADRPGTRVRINRPEMAQAAPLASAWPILTRACPKAALFPSQIVPRETRQPWPEAPHSQVGTAPGGHGVEQGEGVDDETQLLVGEQRVQRHEAQRRQEQCPGPPVHQAQGHEQQAAAQAAGQGRVEVPQQRRGLRGGSRRPRVGDAHASSQSGSGQEPRGRTRS